MQIKKETRTIKSLLKEYQSCQAASTQLTCTFDEALDPSTIEGKLQKQGALHVHSIATGTNRQIVDAYLLLCRSKEEISMLQDEAKCLVNFYQSKQVLIRSTLDATQSSGIHGSYMFSQGNRALLQQLLLHTQSKLEGANECLSTISSGLPIESDSLSVDIEESDYFSSDHSSDSDAD